MSEAVMQFDKARQALEQASQIDEVKLIRDKAEALLQMTLFSQPKALN